MKAELMLNREALDRLLLLLYPDCDQAGARYVKIHQRLIKFFECRRCRFPDELADKTLDRVMQVLESQTVRCRDDAGPFIFGVAKKIYRESLREKTTFPREALSQPSNWTEQEFQCLDSCLGQLSAEARSLVSRYYELDGHEKIVNRRSLAEEFGLDMNTLRIRVHRIREICVLVIRSA